MILFAFLCYSGYEIACYRQRVKERDLKGQLIARKQELAREEEEQTRLLQRLGSYEDLATIELILMEKLGVVPEGQIKCVFPPDDDS